MENISDTINQRTIAIGVNNKQNTIAIDYRKTVSNSQADAIVEQATDMISDQNFRPFFFKTLYIIGPTDFYEALDWARKTEASCRPCMFVKRLKEHRDRHEKSCA